MASLDTCYLAELFLFRAESRQGFDLLDEADWRKSKYMYRVLDRATTCPYVHQLPHRAMKI